MGVSHQYPTVSCPLSCFVAVIFRGIKPVAASGACNPTLDFRAVLHLIEIDGLVIAIAGKEVIERPDDAYAEHVIVKGNVPKPTLLAFGLNDHRSAFVPAGITIGA